MASLALSEETTLPDDGFAGALAARIWRPDVGGPSVVAVRADGVFDVSARFSDHARPLRSNPRPPRRLRAARGPRIGALGRDPRSHAAGCASGGPAAPACSDRPAGDQGRRRHFRPVVAGARHRRTRSRQPGGRAKRARGDRGRPRRGAQQLSSPALPPRCGSRRRWSRPANGRNILKSASVRTPRSSPRASRCPRSAAATTPASTALRNGTIPSRRSPSRSLRAGASSARRSPTTSICAISKGARRFCSAKRRTRTRAARSGRSCDYSMRPFRSTTCARRSISLKVEGEDGFLLEGGSSMAKISRDPADLVAQTLGPSHAYPDGLVLLLGTMFAPVADRGAPGMGFTHKSRRHRHDRRGKTRPARQPDATLRGVRTMDVRDGRADAQSGAAGVDLIGRGGQCRLPNRDGDMNALHKNFIAGEWVEGAGVSRERQPVGHQRRRRRIRPGRRRPDRRRDRRPPAPPFPPGRARRRRSGTTFCCAPRPRSSRAARSSAACSPAKRARPCPRRSARSPGRARSSTSSPARR